MKFDEGFLAKMREATMLLQTDGPAAATAAIQRALHGAGTFSDPGRHDSGFATTEEPTAQRVTNGAAAKSRRKNPFTARRGMDIEDIEVAEVREPATGEAETRGRFISASCTNRAGTRAYKLYIPSSYKDEPLPLVVMLHGCTQNPDDFANGTQMNRIAEEGHFFVAYPEQNQASNSSRCWNWFQPGHQQRDQGEPSILADITREISKNYRIDSRRVYIAGLSAGGAMAAVMVATYPELFAAVGIHSGLPYRVATDVPSAFAAMKRSRAKAASLKAKVRAPAPLANPVPVIVFHGAADTTVDPGNADQILSQFVPGIDGRDVTRSIEDGKAPGGREYTRTAIYGANGDRVAEKWIIRGAGHAWSGGSRSGSYTDSDGPCAAREMMHFFNRYTKQG